MLYRDYAIASVNPRNGNLPSTWIALYFAVRTKPPARRTLRVQTIERLWSREYTRVNANQRL